MKYKLLFPGGMKPFHDGHLRIIESYLKNSINSINEVYIIISKKNREGITANSTLFFLNKIKNNIENLYKIKLNIQISESPSPITLCYKIVGNSDNDNIFCLVSSNKDNDKREQNFINDWTKNGKYYKNIEKVFKINANIEPILYQNRKDQFNNTPISSTIIRNDLYNKNYENFKFSYFYMLNNNLLNEDILKEYYDILIKEYNLY